MFLQLCNTYILLVVFFYISLGNLPRIINLPGFKDNLLITEVIVYFICLLFGIVNGNLWRVLDKFRYVLGLIAVSTLLGIMINGLDLKPIVYSVRLILMLITGTMAGYALFELYRSNIVKTQKFILGGYVFCALVGGIIFFAFPKSEDLWAFLKGMGVVFNGDPHIQRFVSPYLDPNYYSAIACLPLILSLSLFSYTNRQRYLIISIMFFVSIILSGSRSGIATALITLFLSNIKRTFNLLYYLKLRKRDVYLTIIVLGVVLVLSPIYIESLLVTINRIISIGGDNSALHRLLTFEYGLSIWEKVPFFGLGYNYLSIHMGEFSGVSSVDSSLLATLINFGLVMTIAFVLQFVVWATNVYKKLARVDDRMVIKLYTDYICYVITVIFFTSQFNNVLYYQFWLFPVVMLGTYFSQFPKGVSHE